MCRPFLLPDSASLIRCTPRPDNSQECKTGGTQNRTPCTLEVLPPPTALFPDLAAYTLRSLHPWLYPRTGVALLPPPHKRPTRGRPFVPRCLVASLPSGLVLRRHWLQSGDAIQVFTGHLPSIAAIPQLHLAQAFAQRPAGIPQVLRDIFVGVQPREPRVPRTTEFAAPQPIALRQLTQSRALRPLTELRGYRQIAQPSGRVGLSCLRGRDVISH